MFATMTAGQLADHNYRMIMFSCIFLVLTIVLGKTFGAAGLVYAQIINMILRIRHGLGFISTAGNEPYGRVLFEGMPCKKTCYALILAFGLGKASHLVILGTVLKM
jgi:hypothetical protein